MLYHKPTNLFVAHFMGNPPMNFIDASVEEENGALWLRGGSFRVKAPAALAEKLAGKAGPGRGDRRAQPSDECAAGSC